MKNRSGFWVILSLVVSVIMGIGLQGNLEIARKFQTLGIIYINMVKMIMVPLVFSSLLLGITSITDMKKIGKMGVLTVFIFLGTTAVAVMIGLALSNLFKPGEGIIITNATYEMSTMPGLSDTITSIFPDNMLSALLNGNMLQIIFLAVVIGVAIVKASPKGTDLKRCIEDIFEIMNIITKWVMTLTPFGILGLMIPTVAQNGLDVLLPLGKLILVFYLAVILHVGLTYGISISCFTGISIKDFFRGMFPAQVIAFVSCSSAAALPVSMQRMQDELKISKETTGFVLPLGATINMDGNALYQGIVALFVAQAYGMDLSFMMQVIVVLTGTMASIGAAGVPGAGMIVLSTVLASVGLPIDGIALVAGIDRILDMGRTFTNVTGDAMTACIVDKRII